MAATPNRSYTSVWGGRQGHMPTWEGRLSPLDRKILALYTRRSRGRPAMSAHPHHARAPEAGRDLAAGRRGAAGSRRANAHLVYVAMTSQPDCVAHVRPGEGSGQQSRFSAAKSSCHPDKRPCYGSEASLR